MEQGATTAAPIFRDFMKDALADQPAIPFRVPPGMTMVAVDRLSGTPTAAGSPGAIMEAFKTGTEPGSGAYLDQASVQAEQKPTTATGPGNTVDEGTGGLY
jgi:penicillin-binding protein 1A